MLCGVLCALFCGCRFVFPTVFLISRHQVIFGTGDFLQAVTVSSNMGFVRAARSQVCVDKLQYPKVKYPLIYQISENSSISNSSN